MDNTFIGLDASGMPTHTIVCLDQPHGSVLPPAVESIGEVFADGWVHGQDGWVKLGPRPGDFHRIADDRSGWVLDLTALRAITWAKIKKQRDAVEFGTFAWHDHLFDCNRDARGRLQAAFAAATIALQAGETFLELWDLADNTVLAMSAQDVIDIAAALAAHTSECHATGRTLRQQIDQAATEQELKALAWPT